jgi:hypothetical protein
MQRMHAPLRRVSERGGDTSTPFQGARAILQASSEYSISHPRMRNWAMRAQDKRNRDFVSLQFANVMGDNQSTAAFVR